MNCSLKTKHKNTRRDTVFSESHTQTLNTGWYKINMVPNGKREEDRILGAWHYQTGLVTSILTESRLLPRDSKEDGGEGGPRVLVLYQEGWAACSRQIAAQF